ncbi:hypothetical protein ACQJBY_053473 [Aegilops geniculata]
MGAATQFSSGQRRLAIWIRHVVPAVGAASPAASWAEEGAQSICSPSRPDPWGTCPRFNARPMLSPR